MPHAPNRVNILQGEFKVSGDPDLVIVTLLGSCVAACLHDPVARIGGMNHFLLPGEPGQAHAASSASYGVHLMELLVNGLLKLGASRERLQAKLFGGANMIQRLGRIGSANARFARDFLTRERISFVGGSLEGNVGRRVQYWPASGKALQILVAGSEVAAVEAVKPPPLAASSGELELF